MSETAVKTLEKLSEITVRNEQVTAAFKALEQVKDGEVILALVGSLVDLVIAERLERKLISEKYKLLSCRMFGRSSEATNPDQLLLGTLLVDAVVVEQPDVEVPGAEKEKTVRKPRAHGRRELPAHLEREIRINDIPDDQKFAPDGRPLRPMGWEESSRLAYRSPKYWVIVERTMKYGHPMGAEENGVIAAKAPEHLVPRCLLHESAIAHLMVSKFADYLPYYRQIVITRRHGIELDDQTIGNAVRLHALGLLPIAEWIWKMAVETGLLHMDEIPIDLVGAGVKAEPGKPRSRKAYIWVGRCSPREGPWSAFHFGPGRGQKDLLGFMDEYAGMLMSDAYAVYDMFGRERPLVELFACWAHARRKFDEAHKTGYKAAARTFLDLIRRLYTVEREIDGKTDEERLAARREKSRSVLNLIRAEIDRLRPVSVPGSKIAVALNYADNNWSKLVKYVENPRMGIDNNPAENAVRPLAIGRKNWLFVGSEQAGKVCAIMMTIIETCRNAKVDPQAYLHDVMLRLPTTPADQIRSLLPDVWKPMMIGG